MSIAYQNVTENSLSTSAQDSRNTRRGIIVLCVASHSNRVHGVLLEKVDTFSNSTPLLYASTVMEYSPLDAHFYHL